MTLIQAADSVKAIATLGGIPPMTVNLLKSVESAAICRDGLGLAAQTHARRQLFCLAGCLRGAGRNL